MPMQNRLLHVVETASGQAQTARPRYTDAFRADAVGRVRAGQPIAHVSRDLGIARNTLKAWLGDPATVPTPPNASSEAVLAAAQSGSRRAVLIALRDEVAGRIAAGISARDLPVNARLLNETMREIEAIDLTEKQEAETAEVEDAPFDPSTV